MRVLDLSHTLEPGMAVFPGLPSPEVAVVAGREETRARYAGGTSFLITRVLLAGNSGTYLDSPFHRFDGAPDLPDLDLARLAHVPGVVVDISATGVFDAAAAGGADLRGRAVLLYSGWDRHWGTPAYFQPGNPHVSEAGAVALRDAGAAVVGIDGPNADALEDLRRPAHTVLLEAGIPIIENLTGLRPLLGRPFRFHGAPVKVRGGAAFPVRAYAVLP